jgi:hypothetical protein
MSVGTSHRMLADKIDRFLIDRSNNQSQCAVPRIHETRR